MNPFHVCNAGHSRHERVTADTTIGPFLVYDWSRYTGTVGYCTGNCAVSETIDTQRQWERFGTALMADVLDSPDDGVVFDFGTHVGWYSIVAAKLGRRVIGWEADTENIEMVVANAVLHGCADLVTVNPAWVDETLPAAPDMDVRFMKVDIEGNDRFAVRSAAALFESRRVDAALIEISPVFNDTYPDLVEWICACGYDVCWVPDGSFDHLDEFFADPLAVARDRWTIPPEGRRELVAGLHQADFLFISETA